jgi:hypothetical protein
MAKELQLIWMLVAVKCESRGHFMYGMREVRGNVQTYVAHTNLYVVGIKLCAHASYL